MPNILVADDDELLCELVSLKLEAIGHEVTVVADGGAALAEIQKSLPDVLVLDSMMPVLAGPQVLQALKSDPTTANMPIIMLTARKSQDDIVTALRAGAADYITKPFMPDELALRINGVIARFADNAYSAKSA